MQNMLRKFVIKPSASNDIDMAMAYYFSINADLAQAFLQSLDRHLDFIKRYPKGSQLVYRETRIKFLSDFPYGIHYGLRDDQILIWSV